MAVCSPRYKRVPHFIIKKRRRERQKISRFEVLVQFLKNTRAPPGGQYYLLSDATGKKFSVKQSALCSEEKILKKKGPELIQTTVKTAGLVCQTLDSV
ncbi:hypothetical protein QQF64_028262 [Cirrhinus molitorella]|uniref:Uncharacterized protein n=1 Tax=Cirrhinus molitorella TaxID=172907 RepID=A0ABR3N630_9TELE